MTASQPFEVGETRFAVALVWPPRRAGGEVRSSDQACSAPDESPPHQASTPWLTSHTPDTTPAHIFPSQRWRKSIDLSTKILAICRKILPFTALR